MIENEKIILIEFLNWIEKQPILLMSTGRENIVNEFIKAKICPNCGSLEAEAYSPCCSYSCWSIIFD